MGEKKRPCVMASDDQFVKAMAESDHYKELNTYISKAKEHYCNSPELYSKEYGEPSLTETIIGLLPEDLTDKYPYQAEKMRSNPKAYSELRHYLRGVKKSEIGSDVFSIQGFFINTMDF